METKKITLEFLKSLEKQKLLEINSGFFSSEEALLCVIDLLNSNNSFFLFVKNNNYLDTIWLPYTIFGLIPSYVKYCFDKDDKCAILNILYFLDKMSFSKNKAILDLLLAGTLENFDNQKKILPNIVKLMPKNLKELFLKYFSNYLDK